MLVKEMPLFKNILIALQDFYKLNESCHYFCSLFIYNTVFAIMNILTISVWGLKVV